VGPCGPRRCDGTTGGQREAVLDGELLVDREAVGVEGLCDSVGRQHDSMRARASCMWAMATAEVGMDGSGRRSAPKRRARWLSEQSNEEEWDVQKAKGVFPPR
jgi:hypothetical protein